MNNLSKLKTVHWLFWVVAGLCAYSFLYGVKMPVVSDYFYFLLCIITGAMLQALLTGAGN